jgi:hypothetical protein
LIFADDTLVVIRSVRLCAGFLMGQGQNQACGGAPSDILQQVLSLLAAQMQTTRCNSEDHLVGAMLSNVSLKQIFDSWGTDKGHAQYPGVYECLFRSCREQVTAVLEVGIGTMIPGAHSSMQGYVLPGYKPGGSLRAWRDFFVNATIYGLDVQPDTQFDDEERIITRLCDSCDASAVHAVMETQGWPREFDIIIDDGSHYAEDQLSTFTNLFPFLKHNGLYIIEDVVGDNHQHLSNKLVETLAYNPHFVLGPENNMLVILKASRITP